MENINQNIRSIREQAGLSQEKTADEMKISQSQYARFERGATKIDLETLNKFATVFDLRVIDVITWPKKFIDSTGTNEDKKLKASLTIEIDETKKDQVMKLVFGKNSAELLSKSGSNSHDKGNEQTPSDKA